MPSTLPTFDDLRNQAVLLLLNLLKAALVLLIVVLLARLVQRLILKLAGRRFSINLATLLGNLARVGLLVVGTMIILSIFGVDSGGLLTLLSAISLALTLALQDVLRNFVAGLYLLIERPFRIGDSVRVREMSGTVQAVELRTTLLRTEQGTQVIVPNSVVFNEIMTNESIYNLQQDQLEITTNHLPLDEALARVTKVLAGFEQIAVSPSPQTTVDSITINGLKLRVTYWTAASVVVGPAVVAAVSREFPAAEIVLK